MSIVERPATHVTGYPKFERVYDLRNVHITDSGIGVCARSDETTAHILAEWKNGLPAAALASRSLRAPLITSVCDPCRSFMPSPTIAFIKPYHRNNLFHLFNENIIPLLHTLMGAQNATLFTFQSHGEISWRLPHWSYVLEQLHIREMKASLLSTWRGTCVRHLIWGLGIKPYWSPYQRHWRHGKVVTRSLGLFNRANQNLGVTFILRARGNVRSLLNLEQLQRAIPNMSLCCAKGMPVRQMISFFGHHRMLIGMHGAGLTNMLFMDRPHVVELRSTFGPEWMYRNMAVGIGGTYVAMAINATPAGHLLGAGDVTRLKNMATHEHSPAQH